MKRFLCFVLGIVMMLSIAGIGHASDDLTDPRLLLQEEGAAKMVSVIQSYLSHANALVYDANAKLGIMCGNTLMHKGIDCSTYIALGLRGIEWSNSPFVRVPWQSEEICTFPSANTLWSGIVSYRDDPELTFSQSGTYKWWYELRQASIAWEEANGIESDDSFNMDFLIEHYLEALDDPTVTLSDVYDMFGIDCVSGKTSANKESVSTQGHTSSKPTVPPVDPIISPAPTFDLDPVLPSQGIVNPIISKPTPTPEPTAEPTPEPTPTSVPVPEQVLYVTEGEYRAVLTSVFAKWPFFDKNNGIIVVEGCDAVIATPYNDSDLHWSSVDPWTGVDGFYHYEYHRPSLYSTGSEWGRSLLDWYPMTDLLNYDHPVYYYRNGDYVYPSAHPAYLPSNYSYTYKGAGITINYKDGVYAKYIGRAADIAYAVRQSLAGKNLETDYCGVVYENYRSPNNIFASADRLQYHYSELKVGDLIFWSKSSASADQKSRYMSISHVAVVTEVCSTSNGITVWVHEVTTVVPPVRKGRLGVECSANEVSLVLRPDYTNYQIWSIGTGSTEPTDPPAPEPPAMLPDQNIVSRYSKKYDSIG